MPFAPLAEMYRAALAPRSPHLPTALDALWSWVWHWPHACEIAPAIDKLLALDTPATKPKTREAALNIVNKYVWGIVHGHGKDDPRVAKQLATARLSRMSR